MSNNDVSSSISVPSQQQLLTTDTTGSTTGITEPNPTTVATTSTTTGSATVNANNTNNITKSKTPSDFLKSILGRPIRIKLNSGIEYRGILGSLDGYLNIAIEQTEEYSSTGQLQAKYGDCFIRGNNVMYISTPPQR